MNPTAYSQSSTCNEPSTSVPYTPPYIVISSNKTTLGELPAHSSKPLPESKQKQIETPIEQSRVLEMGE